MFGKVTKVVMENWKAAFFMAALSAIVHNTTPFFDVFDRISYAIASNLTLAVPKEAPSSLVIGIDNHTFEQQFNEQSPLNRCELARQLDVIYRQKPALVVVDLDLSPTIAGMKYGPSSADAVCENKLYRRIAEVSTTKTVLLNPFIASSSEVNDSRDSWKKAMQAAGVIFGDGSLPIHAGTVQSQYLHPETLAARANAVYEALHRDEPARERGGLERVRLEGLGLQGSADADSGRSAGSVLESKTEYLNFSAFGERTQSLNWKDWESDPSTPGMQGAVVFYGANYGQDDRFLTALDDLYGVNIHAAAFESLRTPLSQVTPYASFAADVLIGIGFGCFISWTWRKYFIGNRHDRKSRLEPEQNWAPAPIYLLLLAGGFVVAIVSLSGLAGWLMANHGMWIAPVPIIIGMAIDGLITGSVHGATEVLEHEGGQGNHDGFAEASERVVSSWADKMSLLAMKHRLELIRAQCFTQKGVRNLLCALKDRIFDRNNFVWMLVVGYGIYLSLPGSH